MNDGPKTISVGVKWRTWFLMIAMLLASGLAGYIGAKIGMGQFESRIADVEKQLQTGNFTKTLYCLEIENATTDGYVKILRLVVESSLDFPSSPSVAYTFFHLGENKLYVYNGTEWIAATAGNITDHGGLTGLDHDDHTIYLLANGSRALTNNWNVGGDYGIYGATWINTTSLEFAENFYWGMSNRTDVIANPLQSPTYIVYEIGTTFCMKYTSTGQVTYTDTDAFKVLNFSLYNCTAGEYVYLQPAKYEIGSNSLVVPTKVGLCSSGMSNGAIISGGNVDVIRLSNSWGWISDLMVSLSGSSPFTASGVSISSTYCRVTRVQITRSSSSLSMEGSGLELKAGAVSDAICENIRIDGNFRYGVHLLNTGNYPSFYINNNYFEDIQARLYSTSGLNPYGYCLNRTSTGEIAGNTFINCRGLNFNGTYYYINKASGNDFYGIGDWDAADNSIAINVTDNSSNDNLFFGGFIEGKGIIVSDSGTRTLIKNVRGFVTENSGILELANGDSFRHGLAGVPSPVILTVEETDANYFVQVQAKNSTEIQIYLYDATAGVLETEKKTIHWYAAYNP